MFSCEPHSTKNVKFDESNILPLAGILTAVYWALNGLAFLYQTIWIDPHEIKDARPAIFLTLAAYYGLGFLIMLGAASVRALRKRWLVSKTAAAIWSVWILSPVPGLAEGWWLIVQKFAGR